MRPIPGGTWLTKAIATGGTASPSSSCRSRCQVSKRVCDMCAFSIEFRRCSLRAKAQLLANFAGGKAQEQHGPKTSRSQQRGGASRSKLSTNSCPISPAWAAALAPRESSDSKYAGLVVCTQPCGSTAFKLNPAAVTSAGSRRMMYGACAHQLRSTASAAVCSGSPSTRATVRVAKSPSKMTSSPPGLRTRLASVSACFGSRRCE